MSNRRLSLPAMTPTGPRWASGVALWRGSAAARRCLALWLMAVLVAAQWLPALSAGWHGSAAAGSQAPTHWTEVCSAHGTQWIALDAQGEPLTDNPSNAADGSEPGLPGPTSASASGHCAACLVPVLAALPSPEALHPWITLSIPGPVDKARPHWVSVTLPRAQARAPPAGT